MGMSPLYALIVVAIVIYFYKLYATGNGNSTVLLKDFRRINVFSFLFLLYYNNLFICLLDKRIQYMLS